VPSPYTVLLLGLGAVMVRRKRSTHSTSLRSGDASGGYHGFVYVIPEPATLLLLGLGAVMLRKKK